MEKIVNRGNRQRKLTSYISLGIALLLFLAKFYAYKITYSQAIFSDALESIVNVIASIVAISVVIIANRPADRDHPYGHGKVEYFAQAFEGGAILFAGILIIFHSFEIFFTSTQLQKLEIGIYIILAAGVVNGLLGFYLLQASKRLHSPALSASGKHVLSDFWTSLGIIVALILVQLTNLHWIDPLIATIVGGSLTWAGIKLLITSGQELMDSENLEIIKRLRDIIRRYVFPGIIQVHYMRVMRSGRFHHVDLHIIVPEYWSIEYGHEISKKFEEIIFSNYDMEGELHFHLDPCQRDLCRRCDISDCKIRKDKFIKRVEFSLEEITSPFAKKQMK